MEPGHPKKSSAATATDLDIKECVQEAVETLGVPEELRACGTISTTIRYTGHGALTVITLNGPAATLEDMMA